MTLIEVKLSNMNAKEEQLQRLCRQLHENKARLDNMNVRGLPDFNKYTEIEIKCLSLLSQAEYLSKQMGVDFDKYYSRYCLSLMK